MYTAVDDTFRISVRNLVEFMCASGDIDNRDVSVPDVRVMTVSYTHLDVYKRQEEERVLYVAMTRAREKLIMIGSCLLYTSA